MGEEFNVNNKSRISNHYTTQDCWSGTNSMGLLNIDKELVCVVTGGRTGINEGTKIRKLWIKFDPTTR